MKMLSLAITAALISAPFTVSALTSTTDVAGDINSTVEVKGMVINLGAALATSEVETSIGSFHGTTKAGNINSKVTVSGLFDEISVVNVALAGGSACGKVAIGSFGASTCSPGAGIGVAQQGAGGPTTTLATDFAAGSLLKTALGADGQSVFDAITGLIPSGAP